MRTFISAILFIVTTFMANSQDMITLTVNGRSKNITLAATEAARKLKSLVADGPVKVNMHDYGGFEKVGELPWRLPTDDRQMTSTAGEVMLYSGNNIVIFYGSNSWAYTPLGKIEDATSQEIRNFLAGNPIEVTFTQPNQSGVRD